MAIERDENEPRRPVGEIVFGEDLSRHSVDELRARIGRLEEEIARTRAMLEAKEASRASAASIFKS